ncbi:helix-turn-helix domain-containing protein [Natrialba sp. INN-245]|uniref:TrmB family transcriptional regulator n=1 Tax=Natrialba sp. INN-245 TaxID=2690967 RepID=UPI0013111D7B|nr:helix-turn-helix domain-containing protein [Natrialba sp. INN-245]MWV41338.1 TrmB family transcriptional regulator [Natrialba sp. INN-245]
MTELEELGLSSYEESAYRALLASGAATARTVSETSGVPTGRIYDVLNGLEARGIVNAHPGDPRRYVAVDPDEAVDRLLAERTRTLEREERRYRKLADAIRSDLAPTPPTDGNFWPAPLGSEDAITTLREQVRTAEERIFAVVGSPYENAPWERYRAELEAFFDGINGDLEVQFLVSDTLAETLPAAAFELATNQDATVEVRRTSEGYVSLDIVDGTSVAIDIPHPSFDDERIGVVDIRDEEFAARLECQFESVWADADPVLSQ